jgi:molybdopterin converting factor small subunit
MASNGKINVTNIEKTEQYELNGVCKTVADAISKFTNAAGFTGTVQVAGRDITDRSMTLRDGDVVFLLNPTVAGGNVKGA